MLFRGREYTKVRGVVESQVSAADYVGLLRFLEAHRAFVRHSFGWGCVTDSPAFAVIAVRGERLRVGSFNSGCKGQVKPLEVITDEFIRLSKSAPLIHQDP